jgi:hypothetical protein
LAERKGKGGKAKGAAGAKAPPLKKPAAGKAGGSSPGEKKAPAKPRRKAPAEAPPAAGGGTPHPGPLPASRGEGDAPVAAPVAAEAAAPVPAPASPASATPPPTSPPARALPDPEAPPALHELARDGLSVFLYLVLPKEAPKDLVRRLRLSLPGWRPEALSDVQRCDMLADEYRAAADARGMIHGALAKAGALPLSNVPLEPLTAEALVAAACPEHALPEVLWRLLSDPDPEVRKIAAPRLDALAEEYYGSADGDGEGKPAPKPGKGERSDGGEADAARRAEALEQALAKVREEAAAKAEEARRRHEEQREKLQAQLKEARAAEAQARDEAARARERAERSDRTRERAEAELAQARGTDAAAEAQRARAEARETEARAASLAARLAREEERVRLLEEAAQKVRGAPAASGPAAPAAAPGGDEEGEPEDAPASWLMPVYTREFYDSLDGWDRRIQRAAFKQAHLLAQDHRHPSLRALPLEGLPGYYRVRVATDVRLLYRRGDRQNAVEILSLIDREDLDRYVRQAKSR